MTEDYFEAVEADVKAAQSRDPNVVLPWSWWENQGKRHGMSPNAVYTRAVKIGLYVPPAKRSNGATGATLPPAREEYESPIERQPERRRAPEPRSFYSPPEKASPSFDNLGEAIQGFVALAERNAELKRQTESLTRDLERTRRENQRLRQALGHVDELLEQIRQASRNALVSSGDNDG
jgi:hypothetical protein